MLLSCFSPRSRISKLSPRSDPPIGVFRQGDRPGERDPFEARGDIDTVAHEVAVALLDDIAEMDADTKFDALVTQSNAWNNSRSLWAAVISFRR
jgi:hypothetical protein